MSVEQAAVDQSVFREVVGHFASGVAVITTDDGGVPFGTTASAVSSLSMDPPMMLVCLNRTSATHDAITRSGRYAINILEAHQGGIARQFARHGGDKFVDVRTTPASGGVPVLDDALAVIECTVAETAAGGTHTIFLGRVTGARSRAGEPLAYYRGTFGEFEPEQEKAAYAAAREWVLHRRTPLGQDLDVAQIAAATGAGASFLYNALVRLETESVVRRSANGSFTATPVTADLVDNLYDARATIESGVIEAHLADTTDDELAEIARSAASLLDLTPTTPAELDVFLERNVDFHCAIVGLAGSRQLTRRFRELSLGAVWRETYQAPHWRERMGHPFVPRIVRAIAARDAPTAIQDVRTQVEFIKAGAKDVIAAHGGEI